MSNTGTLPERRGTNRQAAETLARVICPERADWSADVARYFHLPQFAAEDLDRFHGLLARHYADTITPTDADHLERYLFVNYFLELLHERARRSLNATTSDA